MRQFPLHYFLIQEYFAQKIGHLELLDFQYYENLHLDIKPPSLTNSKANHNVRDLSLKNDKAAR